ncbi:vascular endothelial growth factor receptor 2 [Drosophila nasuta]|uniref:vascular endothelial growth factor receptor 2 n=1 Tax=Drosophila nasuta TaxID=42062 RepID=UPI00295E84ED|nr:vascular endothelial growth factor receptor 2 [Drosophila nasuta]XP_060666376.1 vascular endothelial growth factor receptor 2 [Drosophila nasuta]
MLRLEFYNIFISYTALSLLLGNVVGVVVANRNFSRLPFLSTTISMPTDLASEVTSNMSTETESTTLNNNRNKTENRKTIVKGLMNSLDTLNVKSIKPEISNLTTEVTLYMQKIPRLQVHWQDNLPKGTTYNVLVSAVNSTRCPDAPCSEYTIKGKPSKYIYLPQSPNPNVESVDCNYMFGCQYNVTVETSNLLARRSMRVFIPHCVAGKCSCQMTPSPPKILARAKMQANDTISIAFTILAGEELRQQQETHPHEALQAYQMQLKINEESNPSLPWGGVLKNLYNRMYNLSELHFKPTSKGYDGNMTLTLAKQLKEKASLNLQALIIDANGCEGPRSVTKVPVPAHPLILSTDANLSNSLIIMATLLIAVILTGLLMLLMRRRRARNNAQLQKEQIYMQSFGAAPVEMEDNINYVDKYVEQSQALGLADIFEVPHSAIHIGQMLGEGAFGRVHEATAINLRRMRGTTIVAVKQLKANPSADEVAEFLSEIEMLKGVGTHHNVVCFLGCCTIRAPYLMIMEYVGRGNLLNYLRAVRQELGQPKTRNANATSCRPVRLNSGSAGAGVEFHKTSTSMPKQQAVNYIELKASSQSLQHEQDKSFTSTNSSGYAGNGDVMDSDILNRLAKPSFSETTYTIVEDEEPFEYILDNKELHNFALQIANGMRFLEEQEITHRDLAARNVLIDSNKTLKISDFGLSRHGIYTNTKTRKLPLRWLSIEAIRDNVYSSKSDIWAYGVVLWEIGTLGASPYPTISNSELIPFLLSGNRLERPEICTPQVYTIMLQCWLEEPEERPTFDALYKVLSPKTTYVDINSLSDDYVFPPIKE